jgi:purine-binding chemotaxis protein CheW
MLGDIVTTAVLCRVGSRLCGISVEHVEETMRSLPIEPLSGMPAFLLGLSIIRGAATPVIHAGKLLGTDETEHPARFLLLKVDERRVALAVDVVIGVRNIAAHLLHQLPPILQDAGADVVSAVGSLDASLLLLLRSARVVPQPLWTRIDSEAMSR